MSRVRSHSLLNPRLKIRQLVLLLQLAEQRSIVRAAESVGMTQPAASKLLNDLEDVFGVKLFERHARGVEPTWYGEILIDHVKAAFGEINRAHKEIIALKSGLSGQAAIGTVVNPGVHLLPLALSALKRAHPTVRVSVELNHSKPLVAKLVAGELDIVIGRILDSDIDHQLEFQALAEEHHSLVVRAGHPLTLRSELTLQELVNEAWILPPQDSLVRPRLNALFIESGLPLPGNVIETGDLSVTTGLLRVSDAMALMTTEAARPYIDAGQLQLLPCVVSIRMDVFGIITHRRHVLSPGAEICLKILRDTAATLYPRPGCVRSA